MPRRLRFILLNIFVFAGCAHAPVTGLPMNDASSVVENPVAEERAPESRAAENRPGTVTVAPLKLPPITESKLDNGLSFVTVEKHDLPLVTVRLVVSTGAVRDPKGKEGIASFTGSLLRRGTKLRSGEAIDDAIESIGGLMGVDVGFETTSVLVTVPSEYLATALGVVAELVRSPSFPKLDVDVERRNLLAGLSQDLDDPSWLAERAISQFFYGKNHPYSRPVVGRAASVKTFERADVVAFHKSTYSPDNALLLFAGDIDPVAAGKLANELFGDWQGPSLKRIRPPAPNAAEGIEVLVVDKPDATQVQVRAVVPGLARHDPRYYAAVLANTVVGGGFTSRLVDEVRVNRGLSYSVGTRLVALREFGAISFSTFTKTETVREILDVSLGVLDTFASRGATEEELGNAKRYVIGLFPSGVESVESLTDSLASMRLLGLPFDEIESYRGRLAVVESAQVREVSKLWPGSKSARIVVVGNAEALRPQLEGLGSVKVVKASSFK